LSSLADSVLVLVVLSNLAMLGTNNLGNSIRLLALQGFAIGALVLLLAPEADLRTLLLAAGVAGLKGLVYPWALVRVLRKVKVVSEDEPLVGYSVTFITGILALAVAFIVAPRLAPVGPAPPPLALAVALSTMIAGLTLTITRRTALAQVLGYVVLENGIFLFALTLVGGLPLLLELGGLLEVFFAVFVMGIAVDRISREFSTIDVDALDRLRG
jgi:hydrogenase-4 component E